MLDFSPLHFFVEDISACNRGWRSTCKTGASSEGIARDTPTFDNFAGGRKRRKGRGFIEEEKSEQSTDSGPGSCSQSSFCSHFDQRELCLGNTWRSYSTKQIYKVYLRRWIIPRWGEHLLSDIRTIEVELWLRSLPIARSTCVKMRNVMSVLFNHALRYEFFDRNPIRLVRQSAKRRSTPVVLTPGEIRTLLEGLKIRERTLVFIAASTGIRQSELFALKWGDIDLSAGTMNVALYRSRIRRPL
jgi:hypothetical protein